ncbi:hypothetical protein ASF49_07875 [Methylobacterium sp. Leaf104]|nr:hypothetical protein ASF49_07875 [Methylobacterium sp. Leaf104]
MAEAQEVETDAVELEVEAEERAAPQRPLGQALALVPPAAATPASELGATTLRLVEHSMETIQALHARVETISDQARDLIRLTHRERVEQQGELDRVRAEAATWRRQAMELEIRLREAQLRVREAEMAQREADAAAIEARQQARAAEAEVRGLESYLRRISDFLQANLGRGPVRPSRGG